jgi:glycosyltransferase involved in cell wall biosynthesis
VKICLVHLGARHAGGYPPDTRALAGALRARGHQVTLVADEGVHTSDLGDVDVVGPADASPAGYDLVHLMGVLRPSQLRVVERIRGTAPVVVTPLTQLTSRHLERSGWKKRPYLSFMRGYMERWPLVLHGFSGLELEESRAHLDAATSFVASSGVFPGPPGVEWTGSGGYILFFGRNDIHQKGIDILLDGYEAARRQADPPLLCIAGRAWKGSDRYLAARAAALDVQLLGEVDEDTRWHLMANARALVFLSRWDGPPRPIREALSVGCPVIVSHGTHMHDLVDGHGAGLSVDDAPSAVAAALTATNSDATLRRWAAGARSLRSRLAWDLVAADYEKGYRLALTRIQRSAA